MRSMNEIIIAIQESQPVTLEEASLCALGMSYMLHHVERELDGVVEAVQAGNSTIYKFRASCSIGSREGRFKGRKLPLDQYLGPSNTPGTPENTASRKLSKAIFKKATGLDI